MSKQTDTNLFIVPPLAKHAGFYQQLFTGIATYGELGNRILRRIKAAHAFRQVEQVRELAKILVNIPIKEYQLIAQYYLVWSQCRKSKYDTEALERIIEQTQTYKAKALISRAAFEVYKGDMAHALYFYTEALRTNPTLSDYIKASTGIATVKSMEGFHDLALKDLENLLPVLRHAEPLNYFEVANSYAVELGEAGRKDEASNVIKHVLASPFALVYPECEETARDLKEPSRSFVSVPSIEAEPVEIEAIEAHHASEPDQEQPATVLAFPTLKEASKPQKPERLTPQELADLTLNDMRELILTAIKTGAIQESQYIKMMNMVGLLKNGLADKILDLEDEETLSDIAVAWAHQVEPEELAAVLSAIRDCEDRMRQRNILDRFIRIVFEETQECGLNEEAWRLRVERRLPKK
jgi:hypothetical protein